jgi:hypothetical protein
MNWRSRPSSVRVALVAVGFVFALSGQTRLDLRSQTKNVDFSGAISTRPFAVGPELPAVCQTGEAWFKPDAPVGQNLYLCAAPNVWTAVRQSFSVGEHLNMTCADGAETGTAECTIAVDTTNLSTPDGNNVLSGITSFPATPAQNLSAGSTVICNATRVAVAAAMPVTLTATPAIADPARDGQVCIVQNTGGSDITLISGTAANLKLASAAVVLKAGQPLALVWDEATSLWTQLGGSHKAAAQILNTTPVCHSALTEMGRLEIPAIAVGSSVKVTIHLAKTSGDAIAYRVRGASMAGPEVASASPGAADTQAAIRLSITQYSATNAAVVSEARHTESAASHYVGDLPQAAGTPLALFIGQQSCVTPGQNTWIKAAAAYVVEAP